jgi:hypothetical protein
MKPVKINPVVRTILGWLSRFSSKPQPFSLACAVRESESVLICMPTDVDGFAMARDLLLDLIGMFRPREVYVLLPFLEGADYLSDSSDYRVVVVGKTDLGLFSLPRRGTVERLGNLRLGMSLDLDLANGFFSRYLCFKCGIPLRIGPRGRRAFPFYNVQLSPGRSQSGPREVYEAMTETLRPLFSSGHEPASGRV